MSENTELLTLRTNQQSQILDQYRGNIYNLELRQDLIVKMLEERGIFAVDEFEKRWPLYLKNEVGMVGPDGIMEGMLSGARSRFRNPRNPLRPFYSTLRLGIHRYMCRRQMNEIHPQHRYNHPVLLYPRPDYRSLLQKPGLPEWSYRWSAPPFLYPQHRHNCHQF